MSDKLQQICADKLVSLEQKMAEKSFSAIDAEARAEAPPRGFTKALRAKEIGLIAEIKKASPPTGLLRPDFDPTALARAYEAGGAACLSVLTDEPYFQGSNADLIASRAACSLPVLRKDFILDAWQVAESRAIGADCILLIMAALDDTQAHELHAAAVQYGMEVLIESHNVHDLTRAMRLPSGLIGINNRNLRLMKTDIRITEELAPLVPTDRTIVCESGVRNRDDISRLQKAGVNCFLVGESLLMQKDVETAVKALTC